MKAESAEVFWRQSALAQVRGGLSFDRYWFAFFTDTLGNIYWGTFPGTTKKREWKWRRLWKFLHRRTVFKLPPAHRDPLTM